MKAAQLLQKLRMQDAAVYQAARLFEVLPQQPNDLWQADVTYLHIPGHGWWYAVTVIDYYSRYLLACYFTLSYSARDITVAFDTARAEAERLHGPLARMPLLVTVNGPSFLARAFQTHIAGQYAHVRIQYRTPTQLGLLERFHQTLKTEEVYWKLYATPGEARESLEVFRHRYNTVRPHWALTPVEGGDPVTPLEVYAQSRAVQLPQEEVGRDDSWRPLAAAGWRGGPLTRWRTHRKQVSSCPLDFGAKTGASAAGRGGLRDSDPRRLASI